MFGGRGGASTRRGAVLHTSRADESELRYSQDNVLLPDLPVCRPKLADQITQFVRTYWAENPPVQEEVAFGRVETLIMRSDACPA